MFYNNGDTRGDNKSAPSSAPYPHFPLLSTAELKRHTPPLIHCRYQFAVHREHSFALKEAFVRLMVVVVAVGADENKKEPHLNARSVICSGGDDVLYHQDEYTHTPFKL